MRAEVSLGADADHEGKTAPADARTYTIAVTVAAEKLRDASTGLNRGQITIVPEGLPEPAALTVPVNLFVRE